MANLAGFDANAVEPSGEHEPLPSGRYVAVLSDSQMKPTKSVQGEYLELEFEVIEGSAKGRRLWARLTLRHPNAEAVRIAKSDLASICRAVGVLQPKDSAELHGIPLVLSVRRRPRDDNGELENVIKRYERREGVAVAAPVHQRTNAAPSQGAPPWRR